MNYKTQKEKRLATKITNEYNRKINKHLLKPKTPDVEGLRKWRNDYPDKSKFSRLYLYDLLNKKKHILGMFHQPFKYQGENRIDLHPKWSKDGKFVSIDSGHRGKREFHVIDITKIIKK